MDLKVINDKGEALAPVVASGKYKAILIDCPPALGMLSMNSLAAADYLLIALQCEYMALEGLGQILRNVERLKSAHINDALQVGVARPPSQLALGAVTQLLELALGTVADLAALVGLGTLGLEGREVLL